ncbi:hypothetical protein [Engelhardtia mirabilis]|uniref:hypothetical protein n=1 Tax=Engelhardtia mirabilis TaxID=2528011 RepID=UPI003AF3E5F7
MDLALGFKLAAGELRLAVDEPRTLARRHVRLDQLCRSRGANRTTTEVVRAVLRRRAVIDPGRAGVARALQHVVALMKAEAAHEAGLGECGAQHRGR